ncbi:hypothetical protein CEP52_016892 [Fusarium oligoseptatum]|uniref:chitin deacetylase n=1 Tax=Fusarium oligoseptatum TaxID=2604345 RepID=A0A428RZ54_9HYPO|nr:hypothetical protein CEP52_016892 [Fusarium oligoseptatum]
MHTGHQIGLHTWDHVNMDKVGPKETLDNLERQNAWLQEKVNVRSSFVRPPFGECEVECRKSLARNGYTLVVWTLDPLDWVFAADDKVHSSTDIINAWKESQVGMHNDSYEGPIVLMHGRLHNSIAVLTPALLEFFASENFRFVSVAECLGFSREQWYDLA